MSETENINSSSIDPVSACQEELHAWKDRALRISADFENYKRRTDKEKAQWAKSNQSIILNDLLTIVDDFDRALETAHQHPATSEFNSWLAGFEMTSKELKKLLQKYDVQEIKDGEIFNPQIHEAVMQVESPDHISGSIVKVLQKGYTFKGDVLRPAKVSVAT